MLTNDAALAERISILRAQGAKPKYHHVELGGNFRLDAIQAAVLRVKLTRVSDAIAARRAHATRYRELFAAMSSRRPVAGHCWLERVPPVRDPSPAA